MEQTTQKNKPTTDKLTRLNLFVTPEEHRKLKVFAAQQGITLQKCITQVVRDWLYDLERYDAGMDRVLEVSAEEKASGKQDRR